LVLDETKKVVEAKTAKEAVKLIRDLKSKGTSW
jgi:ABC-type Mn2+/Zn2+ transport system ATPase subunit